MRRRQFQFFFHVVQKREADFTGEGFSCICNSRGALALTQIVKSCYICSQHKQQEKKNNSRCPRAYGRGRAFISQNRREYFERARAKPRENDGRRESSCVSRSANQQHPFVGLQKGEKQVSKKIFSKTCNCRQEGTKIEARTRVIIFTTEYWC